QRVPGLFLQRAGAPCGRMGPRCARDPAPRKDRNMPHRSYSSTYPLALLIALLMVSEARPALVSLTILKREPFAGGKAFGDTGPYEKIVGIARFAIDPNNDHNRLIVDLDLAPRNADGKVEFESDVFLLAPKDPSKGNGAILYDVNNRG